MRQLRKQDICRLERSLLLNNSYLQNIIHYSRWHKTRGFIKATKTTFRIQRTFWTFKYFALINEHNFIWYLSSSFLTKASNSLLDNGFKCPCNVWVSINSYYPLRKRPLPLRLWYSYSICLEWNQKLYKNLSKSRPQAFFNRCIESKEEFA